MPAWRWICLTLDIGPEDCDSEDPPPGWEDDDCPDVGLCFPTYD